MDGLQSLSSLQSLWLGKNKIEEIGGGTSTYCVSFCLLTGHCAHTRIHASIRSIVKSHTVLCTHLITYCGTRLSHHIPPSWPPPYLTGIGSHSLLRQLDIQNNRLTSIGSALLPLSNLSELYLACNAIETVAGLPNSLRLNTVDLSNNPITSLEGIQQVNFLFLLLQKNYFFFAFFLSFFAFCVFSAKFSSTLSHASTHTHPTLSHALIHTLP
jgi:Leucine-rich repeat (LRR) protein